MRGYPASLSHVRYWQLRTAAVITGLAVLTGCSGHVVAGAPTLAPALRSSSPAATPGRSGGDSALCDAAGSADRAITRSNGDLHVVLHSYARMQAVAPAAIKPDARYVIHAIRHAFAVHRLPNMPALQQRTNAISRWISAHCGGV